MRREFVATRLLEGRGAPPRLTGWWPRHDKSLGDYVTTSSALKGKQIRARALDLAAEWERAGTMPALMSEHVGLELSLVDAVLARDANRVERVGGFLLENASMLTAHYVKAIPSFPQDRFGLLLREHVGLVVQSVRSCMENGKVAHAACMEHRRDNTLALAVFTAEWM